MTLSLKVGAQPLDLWARVASEIEPGRLQSEAAPLRLGRVAPYQNMSLSANRIWREVVAVPVTTPAEGLMLFPAKTTAFGSQSSND